MITSSRVRPSRMYNMLIAMTISVLPVVSLSEVAAQSTDCASNSVHCVDARPGSSEFESIQTAIDVARPGDRVVVHPGRYRGFRVENGGRRGRRIHVSGMPGAIIDRAEAGSDHGIYLANVSHVTIAGFQVEGQGDMHFGIAARDASAKRPARALKILGNVVTDTRSTGIYLSHVSRSLIRGNTARASRESHGIYLSNAGSDNTQLVANEAYDNAVNGIHFNGDASVGGDGIQTGLRLLGNLVHHNGANGLDLDGVRDSFFVNNVVYDNGRHGLRAFAIDSAAGPASLRIVNNTFVDNGGVAVKLTQDDGGHSIFNNVLLSDDGSLVAGSKRFRSDFNLVDGGFSVDAGETVLGIEDWRALGFGRKSVSGSDHDLFSSRPAHIYLLPENSVAAKAGTRRLGRIRAPRKDVLGRNRKGRRDIGAYAR